MKKVHAKKTSAVSSAKRVKCACVSCQCTVDLDSAVRKGNLVYCGRACLSECTPEDCRCEHDSCSL